MQLAQLCRAVSPRSTGPQGFSTQLPPAELPSVTFTQPWLQPRSHSRCGPGSAAVGAIGPVPIIPSFTCRGAACTLHGQPNAASSFYSSHPATAPHCSHVCEVLAGHTLMKTVLIFTLLQSSDKAPNKTSAVSTACV